MVCISKIDGNGAEICMHTSLGIALLHIKRRTERL
jgi:hypothetical protein